MKHLSRVIHIPRNVTYNRAARNTYMPVSCITWAFFAVYNNADGFTFAVILKTKKLSAVIHLTYYFAVDIHQHGFHSYISFEYSHFYPEKRLYNTTQLNHVIICLVWLHQHPHVCMDCTYIVIDISIIPQSRYTEMDIIGNDLAAFRKLAICQFVAKYFSWQYHPMLIFPNRNQRFTSFYRPNISQLVMA